MTHERAGENFDLVRAIIAQASCNEGMTLNAGDAAFLAKVMESTPAPSIVTGSDERAREDTVAFVQDWLMNADYDPSQFDRDFAAAIDARVAAALATPKPPVDEAMRERCAVVVEEYAQSCARHADSCIGAEQHEWNRAAEELDMAATRIRNLTGDGAGA